MKKVLLFFTMIAFASAVSAQNIQLQYDLGKDRKYVTTTVEMFKPDKLGNTFFLNTHTDAALVSILNWNFRSHSWALQCNR